MFDPTPADYALALSGSTQVRRLFDVLPDGAEPTVDDELQKSLAGVARVLLSAQTRRGEKFEITESAFNMLLDLFVQSAFGKRISITSLGIVSGCPPTTALRYIHQLQSLGLIVIEDDQSDGRRRWLSLSAEGTARLREYLTFVRDGFSKARR